VYLLTSSINHDSFLSRFQILFNPFLSSFFSRLSYDDKTFVESTVVSLEFGSSILARKLRTNISYKSKSTEMIILLWQHSPPCEFYSLETSFRTCFAIFPLRQRSSIYLTTTREAPNRQNSHVNIKASPILWPIIQAEDLRTVDTGDVSAHYNTRVISVSTTSLYRRLVRGDVMYKVIARALFSEASQARDIHAVFKG
jgi:hypothetical protein